MSKFILKHYKFILFIILFVAIVFLEYLQFSYKNFEFFKLSFEGMLNMFVMGCAVYYFTECKNDTREKRNFLVSVIERINLHLSDVRMLHIENDRDIKNISIIQRSIFNEISILKKYAEEFGYKDEIEYCQNQMERYWNIVSEKRYNIPDLKANEMVLKNLLVLIINRMEEISSKIYDI